MQAVLAIFKATIFTALSVSSRP